jgi:hypothetical protein
MGSLWRRRVASVGVPRQECGTAGKVESGQIGIFLGSPDLRHLARAWVPGPALLLARGLGTRCAGPRPRSPRGSLPDQATARHRQAGARLGAGGAEVRGEVLAVLSPTPVGTKRPPGVRPSRNLGGRPGSGWAGAGGSVTTVGAVVASWPAEPWPRFTVAESGKGPRGLGASRVVEPRDRRPGPEAWLLGVPIGTHSDGVPSSPTAPSAIPTTSPPPWPRLRLAPGPGEGGRDALRCGAVLQGGKRGDRAGPGGGPARAELVPPSHPIPAGPCRAGRDPPPGRGATKRGCPLGPARVTVPEVRRRLVAVLPLPARSPSQPDWSRTAPAACPPGRDRVAAETGWDR